MYNVVFEFEKSQITMIDCKNPREIFGETRQRHKVTLSASAPAQMSV